MCRDAAGEHLVDEHLLGLAAVAARRGELDTAALLTGAAQAHQVQRNLHEQVIWSRLTDELLAARARHGAGNWDRAQSAGAAMTAREAVDFALAGSRVRRDDVS